MTKEEIQQFVDTGNSAPLKEALDKGEIFIVNEVVDDISTSLILTKKEHEDYREAQRESGVYYNVQWATKLLLNSLYGALGTKYCRYMDIQGAKSITLTGQNIIKTNGAFVENYLREELYKEKSIIKKFPDINHDYSFDRNVAVYTDTDSSIFSTKLKTNFGELKIGDLYNKMDKLVPTDLSQHGHEILDVSKKDVQSATFDSKTNKAIMGKVDKIVRHRVSKSKWVLRSKCGKEVVTTGDHSLMVVRSGKLQEVRPSEVLLTDKLIVLKNK
jgi:DNA polymerase elongation subunit (family B)